MVDNYHPSLVRCCICKQLVPYRETNQAKATTPWQGVAYMCVDQDACAGRRALALVETLDIGRYEDEATL